MKTLLIILIAFVSVHAVSFEDELKSYLKDKFSSFEKYEYEVNQMPKGYAKIEINNEKNFKLVKNYAYVPVKLFNEQNVVSFSLLTIKVKLYKTVLYSLKNINQNEKISAASFEKKTEDVALYPDKVVEEKDVTNKRSRLLIKAGTVLTKDMIEEIPVVNKGDKVVVHAGRNGVDITVDAVTRQDGCTGDVISVQSQNKIFKAKVIDQFNLTLVE